MLEAVPTSKYAMIPFSPLSVSKALQLSMASPGLKFSVMLTVFSVTRNLIKIEHILNKHKRYIIGISTLFYMCHGAFLFFLLVLIQVKTYFAYALSFKTIFVLLELLLASYFTFSLFSTAQDKSFH